MARPVAPRSTRKSEYSKSLPWAGRPSRHAHDTVFLPVAVTSYLTVTSHGRGENDTEHLLYLGMVHGARAGRAIVHVGDLPRSCGCASCVWAHFRSLKTEARTSLN